MLLAIDVGNTNITLGVFDGEKLIGNFRLNTKTPRTSDEYGFAIRDILKENGIHKTGEGPEKKAIKGCIISSVVPGVMHSLTSSIIKYFHVEPIIVGAGTKTGIKIVTPNPKQIGSDRIVDAVGAFRKYGGPAIVLDFGTATTYDLINEEGAFLAGVTAPGIRLAAKALWQETAKLPEVEIIKPKSILAVETISSIQAGLVYGQIGQAEYIVKKMKEESGFKECKVIATGGLGGMISKETDVIDIYDPDLTLDGLRFIYEKQFS
jgi:type III pantothenate kinase